MRLIRLFVTAVLIGAALATGVSAQNGQLKTFAHGSSRPLGTAGFVLTDVVAVLPASPSTKDKASTLAKAGPAVK